jgi:SAM-dependent methyltransferase
MSAVTSPIGTEALDGPACPGELARATLRDIARSNTLFGGRAAVWFGLKALLPARTNGSLTFLDIGAGHGDIAAYAVRSAQRHGIALKPLTVDRHRAAADLCRERGFPSVVADACQMPLGNGSVDLIVLSQVLHHFSREAAIALLRALKPLARRGIVVADLRRSRAAAAGIWLAGLALGFHPVTRRDGVTSVRRGFSGTELSAILRAAGMPGPVHRRPGYRLVGVWRNFDANG